MRASCAFFVALFFGLGLFLCAGSAAQAQVASVLSADAGEDQVVVPGAVILLKGQAYGFADSGVYYSWQQLSGPTIHFIGSDAARASFVTLPEPAVYVIALTVRSARTTATDTMIVVADPAKDVTGSLAARLAFIGPLGRGLDLASFYGLLAVLDWALFALVCVNVPMVGGHYFLLMWRGAKGRKSAWHQSDVGDQGRVVHYHTGEPIADADVFIYDEHNKLRLVQRTNEHGVFSTLLPAGHYTIGVEAPGFIFASSAADHVRPRRGILYTGGKLTVRQAQTSLPLTVPLKPMTEEVDAQRRWLIRIWQTLWYWAQRIVLPLLVASLIVHTLVLISDWHWLNVIIEIFYIAVLIGRALVRAKVRPAYGVVRDALTKTPLDLAVVRIFTQGDNRLVMTRVTDMRGRFFATPPEGVYTISASKAGYIPGSLPKASLRSTEEHPYQVLLELMPTAPAQSR